MKDDFDFRNDLKIWMAQGFVKSDLRQIVEPEAEIKELDINSLQLIDTDFNTRQRGRFLGRVRGSVKKY